MRQIREPHANFSKCAKLMEPEACVVMAVMLLLLAFHTDGLLADGDGVFALP